MQGDCMDATFAYSHTSIKERLSDGVKATLKSDRFGIDHIKDYVLKLSALGLLRPIPNIQS